jgi:hypothetical protein
MFHPSSSHGKLCVALRRFSALCSCTALFIVGACAKPAVSHRSASMELGPGISQEREACNAICGRLNTCAPSPDESLASCTAACQRLGDAGETATKCGPLKDCASYQSCVHASKVGLHVGAMPTEDSSSACDTMCTNLAACDAKNCESGDCATTQRSILASALPSENASAASEEMTIADPHCSSRCRSALLAAPSAESTSMQRCLATTECSALNECFAEAISVDSSPAKREEWTDADATPICRDYCTRIIECTQQDRSLTPIEQNRLRDAVANVASECQHRCSLDVEANGNDGYDKCLREKSCGDFFRCADDL